jgi:hypothetical protein
MTVQDFISAIKAARQSDRRVLVVVNLFAGERRQDDIEHWLNRLSASEGFRLLVISPDLATDSNWDLSVPATFHALMQAISEGLIDIVTGGPPCSTVSKARFSQMFPGPRPVHLRGEYFWGGGPWMTTHERSRVTEANVLWMRSLALMEQASRLGGAHLWEHPQDPGHDPFLQCGLRQK